MSAAEQVPETAVVVSWLPGEQIDKYWDEIFCNHFEDFSAATHGDATAEELRDDVKTGKRQMFVGFDTNTLHVYAVGLTHVERGTVWFEFCNGVHRELWQDDMIEAVLKYAEALNKRLIVYARTGWTRHLKKYGFKETHRIFEHG